MNSRWTENAEQSNRAEKSSPWVFWCLLGLAGAGFLPCIALPAWRDYQALAAAVEIEERPTQALRDSVAKQRRTLEAIRTDPAVASRMAERQLGYLRPHQRQVSLDIPASPIRPAVYVPPQPVSPPPVVASFAAELPKANYDNMFCREPTRMILMLLSGSVLVAAFVLFPGSNHPPK